MPDIGGDRDQPAIVFRQGHDAELSTGRAVGPHIVEDQVHLARQDEIPVIVVLVQRPCAVGSWVVTWWRLLLR